MKTPIILNKKLNKGEVPSEFQLFPAGEFKTTKGDFKFDKVSASSVMALAEDYGNELSADYEHQALAMPPVEAPSAAWYDLELREGALWATNIRWTDKAKAYLAQGEYRYFSPAFYADGEGRVSEYINFALTNLPASKGMQALVAMSRRGEPVDHRTQLTISFQDINKELSAALRAQFADTYPYIVEVFDAFVVFEADPDMALYQIAYNVQDDQVALVGDATEVRRTYTPKPNGGTMKALLTKLGLKEDASEEQALEALGKSEAQLEQLVALTGKSREEALGVLMAWKEQASQVEVLNARVKELEGDELEDLIKEGKDAGKITNATEASLRELGSTNLTALRSFLENMTPVVVLGSSFKEPQGEKKGQLTYLNKSWQELGSMEKQALFEEDRALFDQMKPQG